MAEPIRRRRRVRGNHPAASPAAASAAGEPAWEPDAGQNGEPDLSHAERGLRGLVGGGSSQVTPAAALRARDAARPRPEDLERAETELTIIRRNWTPDTPFPRR